MPVVLWRLCVEQKPVVHEAILKADKKIKASPQSGPAPFSLELGMCRGTRQALVIGKMSKDLTTVAAAVLKGELKCVGPAGLAASVWLARRSSVRAFLLDPGSSFAVAACFWLLNLADCCLLTHQSDWNLSGLWRDSGVTQGT